jgi:hypothetical protein
MKQITKKQSNKSVWTIALLSMTLAGTLIASPVYASEPERGAWNGDPMQILRAAEPVALSDTELDKIRGAGTDGLTDVVLSMSATTDTSYRKLGSVILEDVVIVKELDRSTSKLK